MAFITTVVCMTCGESKCEVQSSNDRNTCSDCRHKKAVQDRLTHLKGLEALTIEERVARIEAWIYDYRPPVSISDMTFG